MIDISKEQILEFANKVFPNQAVNLGDGNWWYIQAGTLMGEYLHYEYHNEKVHLHIEGPNWRPIRNYFDRVVTDPRIVAEHWWRKRCCLTLQRDLSSWNEIQDAFLEIDRIMRPHILNFERSQGVCYRVNAVIAQSCSVMNSRGSTKEGQNKIQIVDVQVKKCSTIAGRVENGSYIVAQIAVVT